MSELSPVVLQLMAGANRGDAEMVRTALANGADVNARDVGGKTALMRAAQDGHATVIQLLLSQAADVHAKDPHARTALSYAIGESGNAASVELLFAAGAKYEPRNLSWSTVGQKAFSTSYNGQPPILEIIKRWTEIVRDPQVPRIYIEGLLASAKDADRGLSNVLSELSKLPLKNQDQSLVLGLHGFMDLLLGDGLKECMSSYNLLSALAGFKRMGAVNAEKVLDTALRAAHNGELPTTAVGLHQNEEVLSNLLAAESALCECHEEVQTCLLGFIKTHKDTLGETYILNTRSKPLNG
jgi:hypothetical protein